MGFLLTLLLALSVRQDQAPLRAGCAEDSTVLVALAAGTPLELRYMMAGDTSPCYKVKANLNGRILEGYVSGNSLEGLESFDQGRQRAISVNIPAVGGSPVTTTNTNTNPTPTSIKTGAFGRGISRVVVAQAQEWLEQNQPVRALEILEPEIKKFRDPGLLALAGFAAWRADEARRALDLWDESLKLQPNPELASLYERVQREKSNDQSGERIYGVKVVLRYESGLLPAETARQMVKVVDATYSRVSSQLGCTSGERIAAIVQSRSAYMKTTNAAEWSGGLYDGRIHVPAITGQTMTADAEKVLAHETTHACLSLMGRWPSWLQEGMAQKLSGDTLPPQGRAALAELAKNGKLPKLELLEGDWSHLDSEHASMAYGLALAAVEKLYEDLDSSGIRNLLRNPEQLPAISARLDKQLGL